MKVLFQSFTICAGGSDSPSDFVVTTSKAVDTFSPLRGEFVIVRDRGAKSTRATFTIEREHKGVSDAEKFVLIHDELIPGGNGEARFIGEGGGFVIIPDAILRVVSNRYYGVATVTQYEIRGGAKRTTIPTS